MGSRLGAGGGVGRLYERELEGLKGGEEEKKKNKNSDGRRSGQFAARQAGGSALAAGLVDARAADVAHPFDDVVVTVVELGLKHLQVTHLEAGGSEGNLPGQERRG